MATLVAVSGAAVGGFFGGAAGAQVGWIVGSIVGNLLFPPNTPDIEGPRLGDLTIMSSAYGTFRAIIYGTIRVSGSLAWALEPGIQETKHKNKEGGKGGAPAANSVSYSYTSTFLVLFGESGPEDVTRIWFNGKLVYDKTGTGDDIKKQGLNFRFYDGNLSQLPDSIIETERGVTNTPAYRGSCGILFDDLPLEDYGNGLPQVTAELTTNPSTGQPTVLMDEFTTGEGGISDNFTGTMVLPDYDRGVFYFAQKGALASQLQALRRCNIRTMAEDRQKEYTLDALGNLVAEFAPAMVLANGNIVGNSSAGGNSTAISMINPDSLDIVSTFGITTSGLANRPTQFTTIDAAKSSTISLVGPLGTENFAFTASNDVSNSLGLLRGDGSVLEYVWDSDTDPSPPTPAFDSNSRILGTTGGAVSEAFGEGYAIAGPTYGSPSSTSVNFYKLTVDAGANHDVVSGAFSGVQLSHIVTKTPAELSPGDTQLSGVFGIVYETTDDTIIFGVEGTTTGNKRLIKMDPETGTILWNTIVPGGFRFAGMSEGRITDGIWANFIGSRGWAVRTSDGELFYDQTGWSPAALLTSDPLVWDGSSSLIIGRSASSPGMAKWQLFRGAGGSANVGDIIIDQCVRAGMDEATIDVTDLAGLTIPGYLVSRQSSARANIQQLAALFKFDGVESDWILKFIQREGKSSVVTIPQKDLAVINQSTGEFFIEDRVQDVDLPRVLNLTYMDRDNDYQQANSVAQRMKDPDPTTRSSRNLQMTISAALTVDFADQSVEEDLYSAWVERSNYQFHLSRRHLALDPADIITVELDNGTTFRLRLVSTDLGQDFTVDISALSEDAAQYTSTVLGQGSEGNIPNEFLASSTTKLIILCSPLLRDSDDVGRTTSRLYFLMGGFGQAGWRSGTLFKSIENTQYTEEGSVINEMAWGSAANALGDVADPFSTDEVNTIKVFMNTGASQLVSVTQLEMVNGANGAALIHANNDVEIIQFRDVTVNADGSRTLSGLLRGRRGTETFTDGHTVGNVFVLLNSTDASSLQLTLGEQDLTRFYRAVTAGLLFEDAPTDTKASPLNDLKPYAVTEHKITIDGGNDLTITWTRQTRIGGELQDGTDTVPLNEDTEEYELEIFDGPGGTEVREVTGLSSPTFLYTSANQTSDGFSPPLTELTIIVYQISAQVGRGFAEEVTIDVE